MRFTHSLITHSMIISEASSVLQTVDHIHGIPKDSYEKEVETPNRNGTGALKSEI